MRRGLEGEAADDVELVGSGSGEKESEVEVGGAGVLQDADEVGKAGMEGLELGDELGLPVGALGEFTLGELLRLAGSDQSECDLKGSSDSLALKQEVVTTVGWGHARWPALESAIGLS
jgi:hypothetical protein